VIHNLVVDPLEVPGDDTVGLTLPIIRSSPLRHCSPILKVDGCGFCYIMKGGHTARNFHGDTPSGLVRVPWAHVREIPFAYLGLSRPAGSGSAELERCSDHGPTVLNLSWNGVIHTAHDRRVDHDKIHNEKGHPRDAVHGVYRSGP